MSVKIIKLVTGEEIIAKVEIANNEGFLKIADPVAIVPIPNEEGQTSIAFIRWLPYSKEGSPIELQERHIVYNVLPNPELESSYREFTSGIITNAGIEL